MALLLWFEKECGVMCTAYVINFVKGVFLDNEER